MTIKRLRVKHEKTFEERLAEEAVRFSELAAQAPHGVERERYLRRARQAEAASHINEWLKSPGLQPPKHIEEQSSLATVLTRKAQPGRFEQRDAPVHRQLTAPPPACAVLRRAALVLGDEWRVDQLNACGQPAVRRQLRRYVHSRSNGLRLSIHHGFLTKSIKGVRNIFRSQGIEVEYSGPAG